MNKKKVDIDEAFRYLARRKFVFFVKYVMGEKYRLLWFHQEICERLQKLIDSKDKKGILISLPPQHGKSLLCAILFVAFLAGINPDGKMVIASYSAALSRRNNIEAQKIISSERYQELFPNIKIGQGKNRRANSNEFSISGYDGGLRGVGVSGSLTGFTVSPNSIAVLDDPYRDMTSAYSEKINEKTWQWYNDTFKTRLSNTSKQVIIHTRWTDNDIIGRLLKSEEIDDFDVLTIPAIRESYKTVESDPRTEGMALWEDLHSAKSILLYKKESERIYQALYQQHPSSLDGNIVKTDWIQYYDVLPDYFDKIIQSWDCGFKSTDTGSYVVGTIWGVYNSDIYLIGMDRAHYDFVDTVKHIKMAKEMYPDSVVLVEDKANGSAVISQLKKDGISGVKGILPKGSKEERMMAASFIVEAGHLYLPSDNEDWIKDVEYELFNFPLASTNDIVDTTSQVIYYEYLQQKCKLFNMSKNVK